MKSKRFDSIIMDDIVHVAAKDPKYDATAKAVEKLLNHKAVKHAMDIEKAILCGTRVPFDPDYEAAKGLIREVVSAQDPEALPP